MSEITKEQADKHKQSFLAVIKWCSRNSGCKIVFDSEDSCPKADVDKKIIHMPRRVAIENIDSVLGTLIHESMHIKHTPKWLADLTRDDIDHTIFNALEDARIETIATGQLKALVFFLKRMVNDVRSTIQDESAVPLGMKVLANIACKASGTKLYTESDTVISEGDNKDLLKELREAYRRIFTVTMGASFEANALELYKQVDEFRKKYNLPEPDPSKKKKKGEEGEEGEDGREDAVGKCIKAGDKNNKNNKRYNTNGQGHCDSLDLSDISPYLIDMNDQAKRRIKETLKKSMNEIIDEGTNLNLDNLTAIFTGDVDELFNDVKVEKKTRTKLYFLMDVSGSMTTKLEMPEMELDGKSKGSAGTQSRLQTSIAAFMAINEVMEEVRESYGMDLQYDSYLFGDDCRKVPDMKAALSSHDSMVGGGTNLHRAMQVVIRDATTDDPANKRIVVILTDGEIGNGEIEDCKRTMAREAQDIRVVFVGIGDASHYDAQLFKHNIITPDHAEAKIIESFEEAV